MKIDRVLLHEGALRLQDSANHGFGKRAKAQQLYYFLFNDMLVETVSLFPPSGSDASATTPRGRTPRILGLLKRAGSSPSSSKLKTTGAAASTSSSSALTPAASLEPDLLVRRVFFWQQFEYARVAQQPDEATSAAGTINSTAFVLRLLTDSPSCPVWISLGFTCAGGEKQREAWLCAAQRIAGPSRCEATTNVEQKPEPTSLRAAPPTATADALPLIPTLTDCSAPAGRLLITRLQVSGLSDLGKINGLRPYVSVHMGKSSVIQTSPISSTSAPDTSLPSSPSAETAQWTLKVKHKLVSGLSESTPLVFRVLHHEVGMLRVALCSCSWSGEC
jgi:hypothetical protein